MDQQNPFICTYDSGKLLIETFGRGKLTRHLEPNLSERNNFEREKILRQSYSRSKLPQNNQKNTITFRDKLTSGNSQQKLFEAERKGFHKKHGRFGDIDQISQKINGIIRSISISCQKRGTSSKKQLERCETAEKLHKLQAKYSNHVSEKKHKSIQRKNELLLRRQQTNIPRNPIWFGQSTVLNSTIHSKIKENSIKDEKEDEQGQDYDDINQRIQYINDKITKYQKKMAGYQQVYLTNKKTNQQYFKEWTQLKEIKPQESNKIIKPPKDDHKLITKRTYLQAEKTGSKKQSQKIAKQNDYKQSKQSFSKQQSYFNRKYKELSSRQRQNKTINKPQHQAAKDSNRHKLTDKFMIDKQQPLTIHKLQGDIGRHQAFVKAFIKQIALDQDFRHAKHMFGGVEELFGQTGQNGNKKWLNLQSHLQTQGLSFSISEVKEIFMPRDDEIDPFVSVSHSHEELVHGIIFAYQACQKHWNENIYHNWSFRQLKQSNFTSENLDRGKKGFISIQDLTFYINTEIDGFYRNRDLLLIYNRLAYKNCPIQKKVKYKELVDHLLTS